MFSQTFLAFSLAIVRNIKPFNCSGNSKSLSAMKTLSHFERVKSFEEEVARLMVTNWISSARFGSCVEGGSTRGRAYGRRLAPSAGDTSVRGGHLSRARTRVTSVSRGSTFILDLYLPKGVLKNISKMQKSCASFY
jgi:hypothetical protein